MAPTSPNLPLKSILEALLMSAARPMSAKELLNIVNAVSGAPDGAAPVETQSADDASTDQPTTGVYSLVQAREACEALREDYRDRAMELVEVASGYRLQVRSTYEPWVARLFEEKPQRYTRALLETLALIAYRQPITRAEIEDIRGVSVSSNIVRTLVERGWVKIVGHKETPGRPALYATTKSFLDYFGLRSLQDLPKLDEIQDPEALMAALGYPQVNGDPSAE